MDDDDDEDSDSPVSTVTPFPAPAAFAPPPSPPMTTASVTPFTPRVAADLKTPAAPLGQWASAGSEPIVSMKKDPDMPRIEKPEPVSTKETVAPVVREAARARSGRPVWQSPWAIAAVLVLIAVTTGVTILGRKSATPAAAPVSTGTLEIGTNPDGVAVFIDGSSRGNTPLTVTLPPGARKDAIILDLRSYHARHFQMRVAVPYRPHHHPAGFAVQRPKFIVAAVERQDAEAMSRAFVRGVFSHEYGARIWKECSDQRW